MESPLTPLDFARRAAKLYPEREAVVDGHLRFTYARFFERCNRWSYALQRFGVQPGDRVAYIAPNTHAMLESFYAVPQVGAILVPINYRLAAEEYKYILQHSGAKILCVHPDYLDLLESIRGQIPEVEFFIALEGTKPGWLEYESILDDSDPGFIPCIPTESDLITINYTSGTTARPKGVMITHRNAYMNVAGTLIHCHLSAADRYLWTLPMFHANGWTFVWTITACGAKHICLRKVTPETVFEAVKKEGVTVLCAAPTVCISLANAEEKLKKEVPRGIRMITAGAPPAAATLEKLERDLGWEVLHVYGLTETSPFISICEPRPEHAALSIPDLATHKARQGVELISSGELMVLDEEDREVPWDGKTLGEIVARGNVVMKGYYKDSDATQKAFRNGWFHTGDAAVVHPDGYVEIRDRIKDIIISGGENISSLEIEGVLLRHPAVLEAAVVGMPHEKWGESPHAFIVLRQEHTANADELLEFIGRHLASFKKPQWISFVNELPKTATGKIQKFVLRGRTSAIFKQ
jgi:fatty-acyl-CoA synthase